MRVSDFLSTPAGLAVRLSVLGPIAAVIVALLLWRQWRKED